MKKKSLSRQAKLKLEIAIRHRIHSGRVAIKDQIAFFRRHFGQVSSDWKADASRVTFADIASSENLFACLKNDFADVSSIFLFGGMINQLLPGAGHAYKYYKLQSSSKILLSQFLVSQTIFTLNSLLTLIFLAFLTGIILVAKFNFNYLILIFFRGLLNLEKVSIIDG